MKTMRYLFLAMMAAMCVTFTACGGDSDDDGTPQVPTGPTGSTEYVDPCLDFGSSQSHVKEWMSGSNWELHLALYQSGCNGSHQLHVHRQR